MTQIIAELCQNHKGDRKNLERMISAAAQNGADIVKMQSIFSSDLTKRERFENGVIDSNGIIQVIKRPYDPEFKRLSTLDLSIRDHEFFIHKCEEYKVVPMTTIFASRRIDEIGKLPWPKRMVKVASYDCPSYPFLRKLCDYFDHLIVSTGASFDDEIKKAVETIGRQGKKVTLLHCVTSYPNTLDMCNLNRMLWLKKIAQMVGWSDHTLVEKDNIIASKVAIWLGADYIERHFTILTKDETKDGPVSITPSLLKELSDFRKLDKDKQKKIIDKEIENIDIILGSAERKLTHQELLNRDYYRGRFASPDGKGGWRYNWEDQ